MISLNQLRASTCPLLLQLTCISLHYCYYGDGRGELLQVTSVTAIQWLRLFCWSMSQCWWCCKAAPTTNVTVQLLLFCHAHETMPAHSWSPPHNPALITQQLRPASEPTSSKLGQYNTPNSQVLMSSTIGHFASKLVPWDDLAARFS